jgi:hypothetical protein
MREQSLGYYAYDREYQTYSSISRYLLLQFNTQRSFSPRAAESAPEVHTLPTLLTHHLRKSARNELNSNAPTPTPCSQQKESVAGKGQQRWAWRAQGGISITTCVNHANFIKSRHRLSITTREHCIRTLHTLAVCRHNANMWASKGTREGSA